MIKPCSSKVIYLDNNATTKLCKKAKEAMLLWLESKSNPSADSIIAKQSKLLLKKSRDFVKTHCGAKDYTVIFTSGASESNCFILRASVEAYRRHRNKKPHIITSATEHNSITKCCMSLRDNNKADITFIQPNAYGCIIPELIAKAIRPNTALISIMYANNELGCINDVKRIGEIAHNKNIPFHTDATQSFGKFKMDMNRNNIDALSMSFHKLYGPMGLGMLIIRDDFIRGYGLCGQISGTQQGELRGGTENVPSIAAGIAAIRHTFANRNNKNKKMSKLRTRIIDKISKQIPRGDYKTYFEKNMPTRNEFLVLGPEKNVLPNTLLLSFVKNIGTPFCNVNLKKDLNKKNIIVSVGSACSTSSKKASHVLRAIKAPPVVFRGVIRISLCDENTQKEIDIFVRELVKIIKKQFSD